MENLVYAIPLIVVLAINIPVWVLIAKKCRKRNEFKKVLRRGAVHVDYKPEFIAELMFSVDHQRRLFRPELFTDCAVIPFSKIRSIQLKYNVHVDVDVIRPGSTIRTFIGGALMGTEGAILGACSGKAIEVTNENHYNHRIVLKTTLPWLETFEIPFSQKMIMKIYRNGKCKRCLTKTMENEVREEIAKIQRELRRKPANPQAAKPDPVSELQRYRALLDDGTITQQEFDEIKRRLLDAVGK